jgi:hypothetical protein
MPTDRSVSQWSNSGFQPYGPDFVILGVPLEDGRVMVIASNELTLAELQAETDIRERPFWEAGSAFRQFDPGPTTYYLNTTMTSVVICFGNDYAEALRTLLDGWKPKPRREALPAATPELERGRLMTDRRAALDRFIEATENDRLALGLTVLRTAHKEATEQGLEGWAVDINEYIHALETGAGLNRPLP